MTNGWKSFWISLTSALASAVAVLVWMLTGRGRNPVPRPDPQAAARLEAARKAEEERIAAEIASSSNEALAHMFNESIKKEKGKP